MQEFRKEIVRWSEQWTVRWDNSGKRSKKNNEIQAKSAMGSITKPRDTVEVMIRTPRIERRQMKWHKYKERDQKDQKGGDRNQRHEKEPHHMFIWIPSRENTVLVQWIHCLGIQFDTFSLKEKNEFTYWMDSSTRKFDPFWSTSRIL